jgi:hypothetical protein
MRPSTPGKAGHRSGDRAAFKLMCIDSDGSTDADATVSLQLGATLVLAERVQLHLADDAGNALIELLPAAATADETAVKVDGQPVFDVAHLRSHQLLSVGDATFVLLPPLGVYLNDRDDDARSLRLEKLGLDGILSPPAADVTPANVRSIDRTRAVRRAAPVPVTAEWPRPSHLKKYLPLAFGVAGFAAFGFSLIPNRPSAPEASQTVAEPDKQSPAVAATVPTSATSRVQPPTPEAAPAAAPAAAPVTVEAPPAPPVAVTAPGPARAPTPARSVQRPHQSRHAVASRHMSRHVAGSSGLKRESVAVKRINPTKAAAIRRLIASYQLEVGFDPEGARSKLRALKSKTDGDPDLLREIDKALRSVAQE